MKQYAFLSSLLLLLSLLLLPLSVRAQLSDHEDYYLKKTHWGVGLQTGLISGTGFSVRFHPHMRFGFELNGGALKASDNLVASFGAEGQYDFDWHDRNRFYGFLGFGYYQNGKDEPDKLEAPLRIGFGAGYDWDISSNIILSAEIGLTWFSDGAILPTPQIGLSYLFD